MKKAIVSILLAVLIITKPINTYALDFIYEDDVYSMAQEICEPYNISPEFVMGIIWKESRFATDVVSANGKCVGLMQISKGSHTERMQRLGVEDLTNPYDNIRVGVDYLYQLFIEYEDSSYVLDLYNGNPNAVNNYDKGKVSSYSKAVCDKALEYQDKYEEVNHVSSISISCNHWTGNTNNSTIS